MFLKTEYFNQLVDIASDLYPTQAPIESVLIRSGIPVQAVNINGSGESMWNSAASYADNHDKHKELLDSIAIGYEHKPELHQIKMAIEDGSAFITEISYEEYIKPNLLPSTANVFIIYDQDNYKPYVEDLTMQLNVLTFPPTKAQFIDMHKIPAGPNFKEEQLKKMGASDIVLLCLTPRFFGNTGSDCISLAFTAFQMRKWVVPILLVPCLWNRIKFLENIHPLPKNGLFVTQWEESNYAYVAIVNGLIEVINAVKIN